MNVQTNYYENNLLILAVKQLDKIIKIKLYYFYTLKAPWDGQGKIKMYYGMSRVKKQLSGKRAINTSSSLVTKNSKVLIFNRNAFHKFPSFWFWKKNTWTLFALHNKEK